MHFDVIENENEELLADSNSILNRWKVYFSRLLNVHKDNNMGEFYDFKNKQNE